jgi:hypothetical protein
VKHPSRQWSIIALRNCRPYLHQPSIFLLILWHVLMTHRFRLLYVARLPHMWLHLNYLWYAVPAMKPSTIPLSAQTIIYHRNDTHNARFLWLSMMTEIKTRGILPCVIVINPSGDSQNVKWQGVLKGGTHCVILVVSANRTGNTYQSRLQDK